MLDTSKLNPPSEYELSKIGPSFSGYNIVHIFDLLSKNDGKELIDKKNSHKRKISDSTGNSSMESDLPESDTRKRQKKESVSDLYSNISDTSESNLCLEFNENLLPKHYSNLNESQNISYSDTQEHTLESTDSFLLKHKQEVPTSQENNNGERLPKSKQSYEADETTNKLNEDILITYALNGELFKLYGFRKIILEEQIAMLEWEAAALEYQVAMITERLPVLPEEYRNAVEFFYEELEKMREITDEMKLDYKINATYMARGAIRVKSDALADIIKYKSTILAHQTLTCDLADSCNTLFNLTHEHINTILQHCEKILADHVYSFHCHELKFERQLVLIRDCIQNCQNIMACVGNASKRIKN